MRPINEADSPMVTLRTTAGTTLHYHTECVPWQGMHHVFQGKEWTIEGRAAAALARRLQLIGTSEGTHRPVIVSAEELAQTPTGMTFHPMSDGGIAIELQQ